MLDTDQRLEQGRGQRGGAQAAGPLPLPISSSLFPSPLGQRLLLPTLLPSWGAPWASSEDSGEPTFPLRAHCLMMEEDIKDELYSTQRSLPGSTGLV